MPESATSPNAQHLKPTAPAELPIVDDDPKPLTPNRQLVTVNDVGANLEVDSAGDGFAIAQPFDLLRAATRSNRNRRQRRSRRRNDLPVLIPATTTMTSHRLSQDSEPRRSHRDGISTIGA